MIYELRFADIGEGVQEGEIMMWHISPGDSVEEEQLVVEVNTEKVNVEITSPVDGEVKSLEKEEGDIVSVGETLVKIETTDEVEEKSKEKPVTEEKDDSLFKPTAPFKSKSKSRKKTEKVLAAPAVRRRAREAGIDLHDVPGTGPAGRVRQEDLEKYKKVMKQRETTTEEPKYSQREERIPLRGTRRAIARRLRKSKDRAAHFTYFDEVNMTALDKLREQAEPMEKEREIDITYLPLIIKALIPALKEFPMLNSTLDEGNEEIVVKQYYNIGIAVDTEEGLMVPVIKNADKKSVWQLAEEIETVAKKARSGELTLDDVQGGTFTITSVGSIGGTMATPIINWPEVGILGVMRKKLRPVVVDGDDGPEIAIRPTLFLSVSVDHRVVDGAVVARFTNKVIEYMENPAMLLLGE